MHLWLHVIKINFKLKSLTLDVLFFVEQSDELYLPPQGSEQSAIRFKPRQVNTLLGIDIAEAEI